MSNTTLDPMLPERAASEWRRFSVSSRMTRILYAARAPYPIRYNDHGSASLPIRGRAIKVRSGNSVQLAEGEPFMKWSNSS